MLIWLILVILPSAAVGWFTLDLVDVRLSQRIESDLAVLRRLEAARIEDALSRYDDDAARLAAHPSVVELVSNPDPNTPPTELAEAALRVAGTGSAQVSEIRLIDQGGVTIGETSGYGWRPFDNELIDRVLGSGEAEFGNAFRAETGEGRLGLVVPVATADGAVVGAIQLETSLAPILDLITSHERFGATSEAHLAQQTPDGNVQFITSLRFERDAAFNKLVPADLGLPIAEALSSLDGEVMRADDYRGVDSILAMQTIEATGWGLVLKIDAAEAYSPVRRIRLAIAVGATTTVLLIIICTAVVLNPLGQRIRHLSAAATRVAEGRYHGKIGDDAGDELGELARSIDQLSTDLEADIRMRTEVERALRHQIAHDDLTGIYNRNYANDRLVEASENTAEPWSVLFLDLDGFKPINDTHGHNVGDEVLQAVAHRLAGAVTGSMIAARWGGDEFVVVLPGSSESEAEKVSAEIRELFSHPISTSVGELLVGSSIGLAAVEAEEEGGQPRLSLDALLLEADESMFAEKPESRRKKRAWSRTERDVATALREDRIEVWYQPMLRIEGGNSDVIGAEALVRLRAPGGELLPPAEFLPSVVNTSIGVDLDQYVAAQAAQVTADWLQRSLVAPDFRMSVNLGAGSLAAEDLVQRLKNVLVASGLRPEMLIVEVSEAAEHINMEALEELCSLGVGSAMDDVGISHSNFDRLLQVRPYFAKLDRRWLATSPEETLILEGLVDTCRGLGLKMIAEGIETPEQHELARSLGIEFVQGFLFGRPVQQPTFEREWLAGAMAQS